jgi:hypothetical protein
MLRIPHCLDNHITDSFRFPNLFAICRDTFSKWCVGKRGRVEECSVAPPCNKRVKTLCGCLEQRVQTKEKYKRRLTTKAYKLSYNYINYTINLVGRSFGTWRRRRLRSGGSRRVRRMSFGCADGGKVVSLTHRPRSTPQKHCLLLVLIYVSG